MFYCVDVEITLFFFIIVISVMFNLIRELIILCHAMTATIDPVVCH